MLCPNCGAENPEGSISCKNCGTLLTAAGPESAKTSMGLQPNVAGLICHAPGVLLLGWISGLIFYLAEKENDFVRFHAMQAIIISGGLSVISIIFSWTFAIPFIAWVLGVVASIILMIRAYQGVRFKMPLVGDWTERILAGTQPK